jgi:hypothetical protein
MIVDKLKYVDPNKPQMKIPLFVLGLVQGGSDYVHLQFESI